MGGSTIFCSSFVSELMSWWPLAVIASVVTLTQCWLACSSTSVSSACPVS